MRTDVFVQLVPHGDLGASDGVHRRHCYWFKPDAPWRRLVTAWAQENRWRPEDLQLSSAGRDVSLDSTPISSGLANEDVSLNISAKPGAQQMENQVSAPPADTVTVRIVAFCDAGSCALRFRAPRSVALRKLMLAWCSRQGLNMSEVIFRYGPAELSPRDVLGTLASSATELEIHAEPRMDADCYVAPPAPTAEPTTAPSPTAPTAPTAPEKATAKEEENRVQVQIAAKGLLAGRVKQSPNGTRTLSFWTKLFAPLGKVMALWCKHQNLARDTVLFFSSNPRPLEFNDTAAGNGWSPGQLVVLEALLVTDEAAQAATRAAATVAAVASTSASPTTPRAANGPSLSVTVLCDGAEPVDFKMKATIALEKMMAAWRKQCQLPADSAVAFHDGDDLLTPSDTPRTRGWPERNEVIIVKATTDALQKAPVPPTPPTPPTPAAAPAPTAATAPEGGPVPPLPKISLQVVATDQDGSHTVTFKLRPDSPLEKMMNAWCKNMQVDPSAAVFEYRGQLLRPEDTLQKLGYDAAVDLGHPVITARPNGQGGTGAPAAPAAPAAAAVAPAPAPVAPAVASVDDEVISVHIISIGEDGRNILDFKMKPKAPFKKALEAWCDHHGIPQDQVLFEFQGAPLLPSKSPAECGWQSAFGTLEIEARPVGGADDEEEASAKSGDDDKIDVHVLALTDTGQTATCNFKMKLSSSFEKMMKAWCKFQGVPESMADFEFNGRTLSPEDTPAACSFSARDGVMKITAKPKEEKEATTTSTPAEASQHASAPVAENRPQERSVQEQKSTQQGKDDEKISIQVIAHADGGDNVIDFKMKSGSKFDKMMKAWCKCNSIPESDAFFEFNGRELLPDDTPASCSWSSRDGVMKITAKPKEEKEATATSTPAEVSQHASAPVAENRPQEQSVQEQNSTQQSEDDEKISIQVVAHAAGGENLVDFKMKPTSRFDKLMKTWCKSNGIPESDAFFEFNGRELLPDDTPASCSWSSRDGVMKITAKPKEEKEATTTSSSASAKESADVSSIPSKDEPVQVQVAAAGANGEQVTNFKLKMTTSFGKLMNRWCSYNGVPQASACFQFQEKEITETDTLLSIGAQGPTCSIRVVPRTNERPRNLKRKTSDAAPAAPAAKRGANAYQLFTKERRQSLATEQPDLKFGEVAKIISAEWKALNEEERRPYQEMAQKAKEMNAAQASQATQDAGVDSGTGAGSAADSAESKPAVDKKVEVSILAEGADGTSEMKVTVRTSMPLRRLMQAWCDHHELPLEEADFLLGSRVLKYEDTLNSLGCVGDTVEVKAVPKGDTGDAVAGVAVAASAADAATPKAVPKAVAKPPKSARGRGRGANRGKRKSRGKGDKSSEEDSLEMPGEASNAPSRRSKRLQDSEQVFPNATLVHHLPTPPRKEKEGVPSGEASKRMSFREYLQFDREQEKMRNEARLARQKRKFVNGDSSDEELHLAVALSLSESQDAQRDEDSADAAQRPQDRRELDEIEHAVPA